MTTALVAYLAKQGLTVTDTGHLISMAILPWTFKLFWAPLIDSFNFPSMGRRRPWIIFAEIMMALTLIALSFKGDILNDLNFLAWMFFLHNCFASLQDVCTDALAVDILHPEERGQINGFMWGSKIIGTGFGASIMGTMLVKTSLNSTVLLQTLLVLMVMIFPLIFRERKGEKLLPWSKGKSMLPGDIGQIQNPFFVIKNLIKGFSLKSTFIGGIFLLTASIGDGINGAILPVLFMQNLEWEPDTYSQIVGGLGTMLEFCGALLGGFFADRIGRKKIIAAGYGGFASLAILFGVFAVHWDSSSFGTVYLITYPFCRAFGAVAIFSLFMHISWTKSAATMFTSYMAISNLSSTIGSKIAGQIQGWLSFDMTFILLGILSMIPLIFLLWINPDSMTKLKEKEALIET